MYALFPQSVFEEHVTFCVVQEPLEQVCEPVQSLFFCEAVLFEQYEEPVPALLHVYVM